MVKETQQEKRDPRALVMTDSMYKEKERGKMIMNLAGNGVHHPSSMSDSKEPKGSRHLFFCKIGTGHMHHDLPMRFHQTIRQLTPSGCGHDFGGAIDQILPNSGAEEFQVAVTVETSSKSTL